MSDVPCPIFPALAKYGLAVAVATGALLLRAVLPLRPGIGLYPLGLAVIVLSAWYWGRGPGWIAALISLLGVRYFFVQPRYSLSIHAPATAVGLLLFLGIATLLIEFSMARRRTERALAESEGSFRLMAEELRTREEHWKQAFENNPTMYFMVAASGTTLSVNLFGAEQLGYRVEELVGQDAANVFHPPDRERVKELIASCLERPGHSFSWELRKLRKDGTVIWVRETARAVLGMDKAPIVLIACENISDAKIAAEELRYKTQLLATITDNMTSMVHMLDADGLAVYVNPATERITGFRLNELIGRSLHEKLHHSYPDGRPYPETECPLCRSIDSVKPAQCEEVLIRKDGTFFPVFCSSTPIVQDGLCRGVVVEVQDMTEHNQAQRALVEAQAELAHVTRVTAMGELAASIAHDVNQPLAAIVTNAGACLRWLAGKPPDLDEARRTIEHIVRDGTRAGEIITGIRALLKKAPSRKDPIDLNQAISEAVALTRAEAQRRRVKIDMQLSKALPAVVGDLVQLQQVILNLILNGVEAAGAVAEGPRELMVSSDTDAASGVLVCVRDTGMGFDKATAGRLFDAFYTTKQGGMGMGLAISRSIIESHRGRIWAAPNAPRGAVFQFSLPPAVRATPMGAIAHRAEGCPCSR